MCYWQRAFGSENLKQQQAAILQKNRKNKEKGVRYLLPNMLAQLSSRYRCVRSGV